MNELIIIKSPWENSFLELIRQSKERIYLSSPFIKRQTAETIVKNINGNPVVKYIHSFKLANFHRGVSDLEALKIFNENSIKQKSIHNIHAKIFIFDNKAVITSANLTFGGLRNNIEYGVLIQGEIVKQIENDYLSFFNSNEYPFINAEILKKAEDILQSVPKEKVKREPKLSDRKLFAETLNDENIDERFDGGADAILSNLSSWKKDVFECLLKIDKDVFNLNDVYKFESVLQVIHPENKNIKPKIRQQLQYLRDLGLLEFVKPSIYKKLWEQ